MSRLVPQLDKRSREPQVDGALKHGLALAVDFGVDETRYEAAVVMVSRL